MSCYVMSCKVMQCYVMLCYVMLCRVMLSHDILHHVMQYQLCFSMSCHNAQKQILELKDYIEIQVLTSRGCGWVCAHVCVLLSPLRGCCHRH